MIIVARKLNTNEKGIGLVEVIAALGVSVIVLTSLVSLSLFTIRSSLESKLMLEGTKIANRELELVRAFRDSREDWYNDITGEGFINKVQGCTDVDDASHCSVNYSSGLDINNAETVLNSGTAEQLTYYFFVTDPSDGSYLDGTEQEVRITVVVEWTVGDEQKSTRLYTDLTNWGS
jgi:Tfp pilus assembly protein PilV